MLAVPELKKMAGAEVIITIADPGFVRTTMNKETQGVMRYVEKCVSPPLSGPLHSLQDIPAGPPRSIAAFEQRLYRYELIVD
jgi:hypothetical protein